MNPPKSALMAFQQSPPPVHMASDRGQGSPQPTQQMIDEAWARMPTDDTGEQIEMIVKNSGGALVAPWESSRPNAENMTRGAAQRLNANPGNTGGVDQAIEEHPNQPLAQWSNYRQDPMYGDEARWGALDPARRAVDNVIARRFELRNAAPVAPSPLLGIPQRR